MINAKYFMGVNKGYSKKNESDFYTVSILYVDGYGTWTCKPFYCSAEFHDTVVSFVRDGSLAVGDPVTVSVFEKNIEDVVRDDRFFQPLNLNARIEDKKTPVSKS